MPAPEPRRIVARTLALSLISLLLAAGLVAWGPAAASGWNQAQAEATLWQLLNGARVNNGLAPVQQHGTLVSLARWRSQDMIERDYFSHTILGTNCQVYCYYDSNGLDYDWAGENIAWNSGRTDDYSPVRAHEQFMASDGHRANVLNPVFTHGGVGAWAADNVTFQGYVQSPRLYTELFMQASSAPAPPPPPGGGGPAPAPPAPAPAPAEPTPATVEVSTPMRPVSSAGIDGVATALSDRAESDFAARPAAHNALGLTRSADTDLALERAALSMRVEAAPAAGAGLFESVFGALLGALFG